MSERVLVALLVAALSLTPVARAAEPRFDHHPGRWSRLAHCESTHRWRIPDGGLQIAPSTWVAFGGRALPPAGPEPRRAERASRDQQVVVAERILSGGWRGEDPQGDEAWPYCGDATR
jgi:hypothetical protein